MDPKQARRMFMRAMQLGGQQMVESTEQEIADERKTEPEKRLGQKGLLNEQLYKTYSNNGRFFSGLFFGSKFVC